MRLYVLYARPLGAAYAVQRTDLVEDHVLCFLRGNRHISATKAQPIRIARMCSDNHTVPGGKMHGAAYHRGIASMPAAGPDPDRARSLRSPSQVRDWAIIPAHLRWADRESVVPPLGLAV